MKVAKTFTVDDTTLRALTDQAHQRRMSVSALANELLTLSLAGNGSTSPETARPAQEYFNQWETAVLAAIDALTASCAVLEPENPSRGNRMFPLGEIKHRAGFYPSQVLQGLRSLERREVLSCVMTQDVRFVRTNPETPEVEHWGRLAVPVK